MAKLNFNPIVKINSYCMPIHLSNGSTIVTPANFALGARVARLKRECLKNLKG